MNIATRIAIRDLQIKAVLKGAAIGIMAFGAVHILLHVIAFALDLDALLWIVRG